MHEPGIAPHQLIEINESQLYELMLDTVSSMEEEGRGGSYIQSQLKAIRSWLPHKRALPNCSVT